MYNILHHYSRLYIQNEGPSRSWSYGSWIYNHLCNQCQTKVVSSNAADGELYSIQHYVLNSFSVTCDRTGTPVSSTNKKTDRHDISEILLKVALNTISLTPIFKNDIKRINFSTFTNFFFFYLLGKLCSVHKRNGKNDDGKYFSITQSSVLLPCVQLPA